MRMMIPITVDDRQMQVAAGTSLLKACLDNDIYIPHICFLENDESAPASCRLCWVEIENQRRPVPACTVRIESPITVKTDTPDVRRLQKSALQLLLSVHRVECKNCPANRQCVLQDLARFLNVGLKPGRLPRRLKQPDVDESHPHLNHYPNRCVLCGKCIQVCRSNNNRTALTFAGRGFQTVIRSFGTFDNQTPVCPDCTACVKICPVGALVMKEG
jgi:NADH dehydrogenase/NADH:ubiquinone oxidoreductase subunit G